MVSQQRTLNRFRVECDEIYMLEPGLEWGGEERINQRAALVLKKTGAM